MGRKRDQEIHFFLTEQESKDLQARMDSMGVSNRGAFIRKMALNGYCVHLDLPELRKMTTLLSRCSNNLNQYAKKANQTGNIYAEDIRDLQERLDEIYDKTEDILTILAKLK